MSSPPLAKSYNSGEVESRWSAYWIEHCLFQPDLRKDSPSFSMVIPPPNITGSLHIGHALNTTLQDIIIRWRRMQGLKTLWIPGTDHAGIATQNVVERQLAQENLSREQLDRQTFINRVWKWREESGNTIINQLKQLGASCDWTRLRFTMDEGLSLAVREVFVRLFEEHLIYRGERLINWCPRCLTALSDIEVEHEVIRGKLYHIRYPLADDAALFLIVATTRPETLLGDTAVAVHPDDPRYQKYMNRKARVPLTDRTIPIVADSILVDREFGTGAVKITPAHDFSDFEAGERHKLPRLALFDIHARLSPSSLQQAGVNRVLQKDLRLKTPLEARSLVVEALEKHELIHKVEDHSMAIGKCYRCKTVVEPYLSPQWFVKIQPLAIPAIHAVESGQIRIIPEGWKNNYLGWMRQIKDWCISRQIWWGHRIPAWYCLTCNRESLSNISQTGEPLQEPGNSLGQNIRSCFIPSDVRPLVSRTPPENCPACGGKEFFQDPDVLDTWFSSALWPFSTLGWPQDSEDLQTFYPTTTLVTGQDILFFWVARMIMMGLKFTENIPFRDVYIHALVRDAEGQKMSKSKGNVIDPLSKMRQFGTDALRFTLASLASPGRDIKLTEERIEGYRNFATKLWNAARFIHLYADGTREARPTACRSFRDRWIFSRLNHTIGEVRKAFEEYRFDQAASILYQFIWHEYCDWFLELAKPSLQQEHHSDAPVIRHTLLESFEIIQRLLHPIMPFITEEIWQSFPHEGESIMIQPFPAQNSEWQDPEAEQAFVLLQSIVSTVRMARTLLNIAPSQSPFIYGTSLRDEDRATLTSLKPYIDSLLRSSFEIDSFILPPRTLELPSGHFIKVSIQIPTDIDFNQVVKKIQKQTGEKEMEIQRLDSRLSSPDFREKAEPSVIRDSEDRRAKLVDELDILKLTGQQLTSMTR